MSEPRVIRRHLHVHCGRDLFHTSTYGQPDPLQRKLLKIAIKKLYQSYYILFQEHLQKCCTRHFFFRYYNILEEIPNSNKAKDLAEFSHVKFRNFCSVIDKS